MKKQLLLFLLLVALSSPAGFGENHDHSIGPDNIHPDRSPGFRDLHTLTADERDALVAAGQKAQQDPAVQAAAEKMHEAAMALHAAMLARDSSLGPIFDKLLAENTPSAPHARLTADEREQLHAARESMKDSPEAAALHTATAEYRRIAIQAMITADPSVAPIVSRLPRPDTSLRRFLASPSPGASPL